MFCQSGVQRKKSRGDEGGEGQSHLQLRTLGWIHDLIIKSVALQNTYARFSRMHGRLARGPGSLFGSTLESTKAAALIYLPELQRTATFRDTEDSHFQPSKESRA
jgi:hypothetical protein